MLSVVWLSGLASPEGARAQGAFCPTIVAGVGGTPDQTGFAFTDGACTNGNTGAFSGAALASQALSDLSQTSTQEAARIATEAVGSRRAEEARRCPEGFVRIAGVCQRATAVEEPLPPSARRAAEPVVRRRAAARPAPAPVRRAAPPAYEKGPVVAVPVEPAIIPIEPIRFSAWAQGFGDWEERSARGTSNINCCTSPLAAGPAGLPTPLFIAVNTDTTTAGFVAGIDMTIRNLVGPGDGVILGVLTGYISTDVEVRTTITSSNAGQVANGSSRVRANLSGPSIGFFATYFNGPFSADFAMKADIYDVDERFSDQLGFSANVFPGGIARPAVTVPFFGRVTTALTNTSLLGNLNYRFDLTDRIWIEPTVGVRYTRSDYANSAAVLGLDDGNLVKVQGGARVGTSFDVSPTATMTVVLTGLAYSDVLISGGFIPGAGFIANDILARSDEGKIRGQGILTVGLDFGNGVSAFVQGDVRGGDNLFGAGGKGGVRVVW